MSAQSFVIRPRGPFSLRMATMGFGHRHEDHFDGVMRLAFCLDGDGYRRPRRRRRSPRTPAGRLHGGGRGFRPAVVAQVARVLSLDHDGDVFDQIGRRDPVIGRLQEAAPGLRPPLFYSPYEAAAWAVLSARRSSRQMGEVGTAWPRPTGPPSNWPEAADPRFPVTDPAAGVRVLPGPNAEKIEPPARRRPRRPRGLARRRRACRPSAPTGRRQTPVPHRASARSTPTSSWSGAPASTDVLPLNEPKFRAAVGDLYGLGIRPPPISSVSCRALAPLPHLGHRPHPRRHPPPGV